MVTMIGCRRENRCEVDRGNAEVLQIVQMFGDTAQIAALKAISRWGSVPWLKVQSRFWKALGFCKTIREDLIKDGIRNPARSIHILTSLMYYQKIAGRALTALFRSAFYAANGESAYKIPFHEQVDDSHG